VSRAVHHWHEVYLASNGEPRTGRIAWNPTRKADDWPDSRMLPCYNHRCPRLYNAPPLFPGHEPGAERRRTGGVRVKAHTRRAPR